MITCLCCSKEMHVSSVITKVFHYENRDFHLFKCSSCGSYTANSEEILDPYENLTPEYINHYIEVGAGIDFMCRLFAPYLSSGKVLDSFIDVGCGFGFTVDFAKFVGFKQSIGVEDAQYGRVGSEILGASIFTLDKFLEMDDKASFIISSEVIEHVTDTNAFVAGLKKRLQSDGLLVLTTPNADWLTDKNFRSLDSVSLAAISPGVHTCLFSRQALLELLTKYFNYVNVEVRGERLILFASDYNFTSAINNELDQRYYLDYLRYLANSKNITLSQASKFRLFKELVNQGKTDPECRELAESLRTSIDPNTLLSPSDTPAGAMSFENYSAHRSFNEPIVLFYLAQYYRNVGDYGGQFFFLSRALMGLRQQVASFPQFSQESASLLAVAEARYFEALTFNLANISKKSRMLGNFYIRILPKIKMHLPGFYNFLKRIYFRLR